MRFFLSSTISLILPALAAANISASVDELTKFCAKAHYQNFLEFFKNVNDYQQFNELNSDGYNCLHSAVLARNEPVAHVLITRAKSVASFDKVSSLNLNLPCSSEKGSLTALQLASINGQSKIFKYFLFCPNVATLLPDILNVRDEFGNNLLQLAAFNGHVAIVNLLLREKPLLFAAFVNEKRFHDRHSALSLAVSSGNGFVVEALLNSGSITWQTIDEVFSNPHLQPIMNPFMKDLFEMENIKHRIDII